MAGGGSGRLGESIEMRKEQIENVFSASWKAHKSPNKHYILEKNNSKSNPPEVIISFPGIGSVKDWYSKRNFGETKINLTLFPSLRSIGNDEAALVNEFFQLIFQEILAKSSLAEEVRKAIDKNKQIVFTGHSSGGSVAILATLWALEQYQNPKSRRGIPPLCVTFGSPLIGNHIFSHATRRENWSRYFFHYVMRYDIVPRTLLAPLSAFDQRFETISQSFNPKTRSFLSESTSRSTQASDFYFAVMSNAATVTSHTASKLMGGTDTTLETLANFVPLSPYRPFGTYIFCTGGNGKGGIEVKNPDAVFQLLFFSAQLISEAEATQVPQRSLHEHTIYSTELKQNLGSQYVYLDLLEKLPLSENGSGGHTEAVITALNDLGLSTRARLCLRAAAESEAKKLRNEEDFNKKIKSLEKKMEDMEEYRKTWEILKVGYYDGFRMQNDEKDFKANVRRLELAGVWDEIIEKLRSYELPDELEGKEDWVRHGTKFRRLVEPLDIANYYRHLRHGEAGTYMDKGRPKRYRFTQRWLEHFQRRPQEAISESCFWAEVEDLRFIASNKSNWFEDANLKERVLQLEGQILEWSKDHEKLSKDAFLEGSTLVKWWKYLPLEHKEVSSIRGLIKE